MEALVSSDDDKLSMSGGISMALSHAGGRTIDAHARKLLPLKQCDVVVTTAGKLPAKYIFHAVTTDLDGDQQPDERVIEAVTGRALRLADTLNVTTLAFPALGAGAGGFPFQRSAAVMVQAIADYLSGDTAIKEVGLYLAAREGGSQSRLNVFYQRAVSLAASAGQTKRLMNAAEALGDALVDTGSPELEGAVADLLADLASAHETLVEQPQSAVDADRLQDDSLVLDAGREAVELTNRDSWDDRRTELTALRTRIEGLSVQLNVHYGSLNKEEIERARYGGIGVPLILENQILAIQEEVKRVEAQLLDTRAKLAKLAEH